MLHISELKYYINTNLQGFVPNPLTGNTEIHTLVGLTIEKVITDRNSNGIPYNEFKPIMRRLDSLTVPLTDENGIELYPIVVLAKYGDLEYFRDGPFKLKKIVITDEVEFRFVKGNNYCCSWDMGDGRVHKFFYNENTSSFISNQNDEKFVVAINQENLFKILYNWNFWTGDQKYFDTKLIYDINEI